MVKKIGQDKKVVKKVTCKYCGAILKYLPKDIKQKMYENFDPSFWIVCPQCKTEVTVPHA